MKNARPRLLFAFTGGTLLMREAGPSEPPAHGGKRPLRVADDVAAGILAEIPSLSRLAEIEMRSVFSLDSGDMQPTHWVELARVVHEALSQETCDGIVIVHGTDTMAYTASGLAFLLGPLPKPVVLTGAQRPLVETRSDARQNLIDAATVATLDVPEVSIVFAEKALRGARATKRDAWAFDAFDSPNCPALVHLGIDVERGSHVRAPGALLPFDDRIEPRVLAVRIFPGLDPALVSGALRAGVRGLVLEAYGTGNLPHLENSLIPALEEARRVNVPVVVVSQCLRGHVELGRYGGGADAARVGAISGGDMTVEAALAKLMIGLGRFGAGEALRDFIEGDVIGERDESPQVA